ncbi:hypothetical protein QF017_002669 [Pseudomonas laurylsulfatiphila]
MSPAWCGIFLSGEKVMTATEREPRSAWAFDGQASLIQLPNDCYWPEAVHSDGQLLAEGWQHSQVGRPGREETGRLESPLCITTIKPGRMNATTVCCPPFRLELISPIRPAEIIPRNRRQFDGGLKYENEWLDCEITLGCSLEQATQVACFHGVFQIRFRRYKGRNMIKPQWAATRAPVQSARAIAPARSDGPSSKASIRQTTGTTTSALAPGRRLPVLRG